MHAPPEEDIEGQKVKKDKLCNAKCAHHFMPTLTGQFADKMKMEVLWFGSTGLCYFPCVKIRAYWCYFPSARGDGLIITLNYIEKNGFIIVPRS